MATGRWAPPNKAGNPFATPPSNISDERRLGVLMGNVPDERTTVLDLSPVSLPNKIGSLNPHSSYPPGGNYNQEAAIAKKRNAQPRLDGMHRRSDEMGMGRPNVKPNKTLKARTLGEARRHSQDAPSSGPSYRRHGDAARTASNRTVIAPDTPSTPQKPISVERKLAKVTSRYEQIQAELKQTAELLNSSKDGKGDGGDGDNELEPIKAAEILKANNELTAALAEARQQAAGFEKLANERKDAWIWSASNWQARIKEREDELAAMASQADAREKKLLKEVEKGKAKVLELEAKLGLKARYMEYQQPGGRQGGTGGGEAAEDVGKDDGSSRRPLEAERSSRSGRHRSRSTRSRRERARSARSIRAEQSEGHLGTEDGG